MRSPARLRRQPRILGPFALATMVVLVASCGDRGESPGSSPQAESPDSAAQGPDGSRQVGESGDGVVAAAHPLAARAGARMLEMGGSAADAAVAAAFTLAVVEPTMSGLGGRVQVLGRTPGGDYFGIDGTTQAPIAYDTESAPQGDYGYVVVGIPGQVAGVLQLHERYGRLPLADVMAPAIDHARIGFPLLAGEAARLTALREELLESEGAGRTFVRLDGAPWVAGDTLVQEDLARTLAQIADEGADAFYTGSIAEQIVTDMELQEGFVTLADLAQYRAVDVEVVRGSYRGWDLVGTARPAGGTTAIEALQIMEHFETEGLAEADWASLLGQSLMLAFQDRYRAMMPQEEEVAVLTSKAWAGQRAQEVQVPPGVPVPIGAGAAAFPQVDMAPHWLAQEHTTHLTAADRDGMVVALTQSLGPSGGSRVATPGLGFLYASTIGGYLGPMTGGQRAASAITPLVIERDGETAYAMGAAGGLRILSAVVQVTARLIDQGLPLAEAVAAPRLFPGFRARSDPEPWDFEGGPVAGWDSAQVAGQAFEARLLPRADAFGRIHAVAYDAEDGVWTGVADPRWEGAVAVPRPLGAAGSVATGGR